MPGSAVLCRPDAEANRSDASLLWSRRRCEEDLLRLLRVCAALLSFAFCISWSRLLLRKSPDDLPAASLRSCRSCLVPSSSKRNGRRRYRRKDFGCPSSGTAFCWAGIRNCRRDKRDESHVHRANQHLTPMRNRWRWAKLRQSWAACDYRCR